MKGKKTSYHLDNTNTDFWSREFRMPFIALNALD